MGALLDTHAFLWWLAGERRLSRIARRAIAADETEVFVSAASAWAIATKHRLGKLPQADALARDIRACIAGQNFTELPVTVADADCAGCQKGPVRDPFDRMLVAQALLHNLELVSNEEVFDRYGVKRLW